MCERDYISVQTADFDLNQQVLALRSEQPGIGAVVSFVGLVRDVADGERVVLLGEGVAEIADVRAAIHEMRARCPAAAITVCGYSFGTGVALGLLAAVGASAAITHCVVSIAALTTVVTIFDHLLCVIPSSTGV